jgi:hypothetical protein
MGGLSDETGKTEAPCHSRCSTIKILPSSKTLSAEQRPKFCSPSPAMDTSPYQRKILERDVKLYIKPNLNTLILTFEMGLTAGVTGRQGMFALPRHLIPPLVYLKVLVCPIL